jgi:hypothetical protein
VEKIDYLLWTAPPQGAVRAILDAGVAALTVHLAADDIPNPPLLLGRGPDLAAVVCVWVDSIDDRGPIEDALVGADGYLVTESVPQKRIAPSALTHFTWFPKPDRLTSEQFFHGWHEVHTPSTFALHPTRCGYVRDSVSRELTAGSPRVDAIVFEDFPTVEDYTDPKRLFGSKEALDETSRHLRLFAEL